MRRLVIEPLGNVFGIQEYHIRMKFKKKQKFLHTSAYKPIIFYNFVSQKYYSSILANGQS